MTAAIAVISLWFALSGPLGVNGLIAVPLALLWGVVIAGIDRLLITSLPQSGRRTLVVVPRLVLALLLGSLVATPIVLQVFHSEIVAQVAINREQQAAAQYEEAQNGPVGQAVRRYQAQITQLRQIIDSGST